MACNFNDNGNCMSNNGKPCSYGFADTEDYKQCSIIRLNRFKKTKSDSNKKNTVENEEIKKIKPKKIEKSEFEMFIEETPELKKLFDKWKEENNKPVIQKELNKYLKNFKYEENSIPYIFVGQSSDDIEEFDIKPYLKQSFMHAVEFIKTSLLELINNNSDINDIENWLFKECRRNDET